MSYSESEKWFEERKRKGTLPTREKLGKRVPVAPTRLMCVEHRDGQAFFRISEFDPKCTALLAVPTKDEPVISRLEIRYIILKPSQSKTSKWRVSFLYRWYGRSSRMETEVPLEAVVPHYKIVDGDTVAEFSRADLEQRETNKAGKALRNPLSLVIQDSTGWASTSR